MKSTFILLGILSFSFLCAQEAPEIEWSKNYGGSDFEEAYDVKQTPDGGYIVVGYTQSNDVDVSENKGGKDYWIVKLNQNGEMEWEKSYGGSEWDVAYSVEITSEGNYVIVGESYSIDGDVEFNHGGELVFSTDIWLIVINSDGNMISQKSLGGTNNEYLPSIIKTNDGGFAIISSSSSDDGDISTGNQGGFDYWLVKLNEVYEIEWSKTYGGTSNEAYINSYNPSSIIQTIDGGFLIAGGSESNNGDLTENQGNLDYWVFKTDSIGEIIWQKSMGGSGYEFALSSTQINTGGYLVTGFSDSTDGDINSPIGFTDSWVVRLTDNGEIQWEKSFGGSNVDWGTVLKKASDNNIYMGSVIYSDDGDISVNYGAGDFWLLKMNESGEIIWEKNYGGSGAELLNSIIIDEEDKFSLIGLSRSSNFDVPANNGETDFWILKLGPDQMSTSEINPSQISIYPNPVKDILNFSEKLNDIQIFNLAGQKVFESPDKNKVNVSHLNSGTFVLKAKNQKGESVQLKFIKN